MNKAELVYELMELRSGILHFNVQNIPRELNKQDITLQKLDYIIGKIIKDEDQVELEVGCTENCPAMKKVDNLADAIDQAVLMSEAVKKPFKVGVGVITAYEAMKMAEGGND